MIIRGASMTCVLENIDDEIKNIYRDRENQLIVCSYKNAATDNNGGMLRFYDVSGSGMKSTLKPGLGSIPGSLKLKMCVIKRSVEKQGKQCVVLFFSHHRIFTVMRDFGGGQQEKEAIWLLGHQTGP